MPAYLGKEDGLPIHSWGRWMRRASQRADPQQQPLPFIKPLPATGTRKIRKSFYLQRRASDKGRPSQLLPLVPASPMRHAHRQPQHHEGNLSPEANHYPLQTASAQQPTPPQPSHPCEGGTRPSGCSSQTAAGKRTLQLRFNSAPAGLTPISLSHVEREHGPAPASAEQHPLLSQ